MFGTGDDYAFGVTFVLLKIINIFVPVRVSPDQELAGLDNAIHRETAYNLVD